MSLSIQVELTHATNGRPLRFRINQTAFDIALIEDLWQEPDAACFKVRSTGQKTFLLRYDNRRQEWTLQAGFDGDELLKTD